jgi:hypothetical protein
MKYSFSFLFLILFCFFLSCSTAKQIQLVEKTETITRDTTIYLPSIIVRDTINLRDTLIKEYYVSDSTGKLEIKLIRDSFGRLIASCESKKDTLIVKEQRTINKYLEKGDDTILVLISILFFSLILIYIISK